MSLRDLFGDHPGGQAGEGSGSWFGAGAGRLGLRGEVASTDLWWVLQGKDPRTQETLVGAQGSAGRAHRVRGELDGRDWWSLKDAGEVAGVSPRYLRALAEQTREVAARRLFELLAGQPLSAAPSTWLVAEKHKGAWRVSGTELADYLALRKAPTVVVGYDVTFSVEKSVSALWARADDATRGEIIAAEVRLALAEYRDGAITAAIERLGRDQRIVTANSAGELLDAMTTDWYVHRQRAAADPEFARSSMTAAHHDERRALVARARALLKADGTLHGPELVAAGMAFCAGDEVIAKVPDRSLRPAHGERTSFVKNGTRGTVVTVDQDHLVVDFEHRGQITVPRRYLDPEVAPGIRGGLLHSYCLTTYAAQGDTYGAARHLGTDRSSRAELYVGLTRGRHDVTLYAVGREQFMGQVVDDDLPRLSAETEAARAMAASAAAGGAERLAREMDPMVGQAFSLVDPLHARRVEGEPRRSPRWRSALCPGVWDRHGAGRSPGHRQALRLDPARARSPATRGRNPRSLGRCSPGSRGLPDSVLDAAVPGRRHQ